MPGPITPSSPLGASSGSNSGSNPLSNEAKALLKDQFGFKGIKVVSVTKGADSVDGLKVMKHLQDAQSSELLKEMTQLASNKDSVDSVIVLIGGQEIMQEGLKDLFKSKKELRLNHLKETLKKLGLLSSSLQGSYISPDISELPGGVLLIEKGLDEIEESIS